MYRPLDRFSTDLPTARAATLDHNETLTRTGGVGHRALNGSSVVRARLIGLFPETRSIDLPTLKATPKSRRPNGVIVWEGFSPIDGAPLVAVATGIVRPSDNRKTGPMVQVWIMRADVSPLDAVQTGQDESQCGDCALRPIMAQLGKGGGCYVQIGQAPQGIWKAYRRGSYPRVSTPAFGWLIQGRALRLGAYGDPAMVPIRLLEKWTGYARKHTGYTHQWRGPLGTPELRALVMASADTAQDRADALAAGWRYFGLSGNPAQEEGAIECPADRGLTDCASCGLCDGDRKGAPVRSIVIRPHGSAAKRAAKVAGIQG